MLQDIELHDPECVANHVRAIQAVRIPGSDTINSGRLQDIGERLCKSEITRAIVAQLGEFGDELPSVKECRESVYDFAIQRSGGDTKLISSLQVSETILLDDRVIQKGEDGRIWWIEKGAYYYYSWTDMVWKFFHSHEQMNSEEVVECNRFLRDYENALDAQSEDILKSLHELKHFYAAMSICTTSKLCDAFVSCDAFNTNVNNCLANWQEYFELWSAKERDSEYSRLQRFVTHCGGNSEFLEYSITQDKSRMLDIHGFLNIW